MVTHQTFKQKGEWIEPTEVERVNGEFFEEDNKKVVVGKTEKMSKSKKMSLIQMI